MSTLREAAQQALNAMQSFERGTNGLYEGEFAEEIAALRAALAEPVEAVAWLSPASQSMIGRDDGEGSAYHIITTSKATGNHTIPLYTAPPQRKPLSVTDLQQALVYTNLIDRDAIDDPDNYDEGSTLAQIDELHQIISRAHGIE